MANVEKGRYEIQHIARDVNGEIVKKELTRITVREVAFAVFAGVATAIRKERPMGEATLIDTRTGTNMVRYVKGAA